MTLSVYSKTEILFIFFALKIKTHHVKKKENMFDWNPYLIRVYVLTRTNIDKKKKIREKEKRKNKNIEISAIQNATNKI